MSEPLIVGIRHHSPACARLVKSLIESQRPRYVLIEGPADFNDRVDELFLAHQLPVAIYSYCQYQDGAAPGRGAWTPFAEFFAGVAGATSRTSYSGTNLLHRFALLGAE
ncbi:protein [Escherichia coli]|uniref:Protein n=1 Tax=Escherichia coli TaxID=562 RepID=A0A376KST0_ECOLX|nr:protein [Escherichia coli]